MRKAMPLLALALVGLVPVGLVPASATADTCKASPNEDHCYSIVSYIMKPQDGEYVYGAYDNIESYYGKVPLWYEGNRINNEMWVGLGSEYNTHWVDGGAMIGSGYNSDVAVVVMHGHFKLTDAAVKPGTGEVTGKTLTLIIDRSSGAVDASELSPEAAPGLSALGPQQALVSGGEASTTATAASRKSVITGEAHVEGPSKVGFVPPAVERFRGVVVAVSQGGKVVRTLKTSTDTRFSIPVRPGTYKVTATLGPPTINPRPRSCGSTTLRIKSSREVRFVCSLTG